MSSIPPSPGTFPESFSPAARFNADSARSPIKPITDASMPKIIALTADVISRKAEVERDIDVLLTSRRYEQKIMNLVPFAIIMYLSMSSPGFFDALYGNVLGIAVMTGCLAVYMFSCALSDRITSIEV